MDKFKIFVYGSPETERVLQEIKDVLGIRINALDHSADPNYMYGYSPCAYDRNCIWYSSLSENSHFFSDNGYQVVTPQEFRDAWLGKDLTKDIIIEPKTFCCKGCEKLRKVCQKLAEEGFINPSKYNDFEMAKEDGYYHRLLDKSVVYKPNGKSTGEIVSPEEFYERIAGKPWEEKKKIECLGFIGAPNVKIGLLPMKIKNPSSLKGTSPKCIYYIENNELTSCTIGCEPKYISFKIVPYVTFLIKVTDSIVMEQLSAIRPLRPEHLFASQQKMQETNFIQHIVKNPSEDFLYLSKEKPFKINL